MAFQPGSLLARLREERPAFHVPLGGYVDGHDSDLGIGAPEGGRDAAAQFRDDLRLLMVCPSKKQPPR